MTHFIFLRFVLPGSGFGPLERLEGVCFKRDCAGLEPSVPSSQLSYSEAR